MRIPKGIKPCSLQSNKTGSWRTFRPKFIHEKCTACGTCERVCPEGICRPVKGKKYFDFDPDFCKGCGICAHECPFKAIEMEYEKK